MAEPKFEIPKIIDTTFLNQCTDDQALELVQQDPFIFGTLSPRQQDIAKIALTALRRNAELSNGAEIFQYTSPRLHKNPDFIKEAASVNGFVATQLSPRQRTKDILKLAVRSNPDVLEDLSPYPCDDEDLAIEALTVQLSKIVHISEKLLNSPRILKLLNKNKKQAHDFQEKELKKIKKLHHKKR
jgi:hypothetical protein